MNRSSSLPLRRSPPADDPAPSSAEDASALGAYGWPFWLAYVNNLCLMTAISMLYRGYADLVTVLGGDEWQLGWILGVGMVGSLMMRLAQGVGIDHYGPRLVWICSTAAFAVVCWCHLGLTTTQSPAIYLLRIVLWTAIAGAFGCANTFISSRVAVVRVAEVVGTLGTSGFIGMVLGSNLADWLSGTIPGWLARIAPERAIAWLTTAQADPRAGVDRMFVVTGALGILATIFASLATRGAQRPPAQVHPPLRHLLRRYHPGLLIPVALAVGIGTGLPINYVRPFTEELGLPRIGLFFTIYATAAFAIRLTTRGWAERFGIRPMVCLGLGTLTASMLLYLVVRPNHEWLLAIPAVAAGMAHAFLFPSVVGGGSTSFPPRHRGLGMTVMMSLTDLGNLIGAPLCALILRGARHSPLADYAYPTLFITMAVLMGSACMLYVRVGKNRRPGGDSVEEVLALEPAPEVG